MNLSDVSCKHQSKNAFTLIELLVVISIISLLASVILVALQGARNKAVTAGAIEFDNTLYHSQGTDLLGQWLFDEGSGAVANDLLGKGINGTIVGATWTDGIAGKALTFNGVSGNTYVLLSNSTQALDPPNFTITAWVKPGDFSGSYNYIFSNSRDCCGSYNGIEFLVNGNRLRGYIWNLNQAAISSNAIISNNPVWTFVAFSYDGSKMRLYINGKIDSIGNSTLGVGSPSSYNAAIGGMGMDPITYEMNGSIDQVRLYSIPITAMEIERQYALEKTVYLAKE